MVSLQLAVHSLHARLTANCPLPTANSFTKGQLAKITETFSENLMKTNISALKVGAMKRASAFRLHIRAIH